MPLAVLGIIVLAALFVVVIGTAVLALGDSFRNTREAERKRSAERAAKAPQAPPTLEEIRRYTPRHTRLRWYSPEIVALLLLALAAGLWIARLTG